HRLDLVEMAVDLVAGLVDRAQRCARQLELAARLEADVAVALVERDRVAVLDHRLPTIARQTLEQRADAARAVVGQPAMIVERERELLVLGADAPLVDRLAAGLEPRDELPLVGDRVAPRRGSASHPLSLRVERVARTLHRLSSAADAPSRRSKIARRRGPRS